MLNENMHTKQKHSSWFLLATKKEKRKNSVRKEGKEGKMRGGGKKEVGRKNGRRGKYLLNAAWT